MVGAAARGKIATSVSATASRHALFIFVSVSYTFGRKKERRYGGREDIRTQPGRSGGGAGSNGRLAYGCGPSEDERARRGTGRASSNRRAHQDSRKGT